MTRVELCAIGLFMVACREDGAAGTQDAELATMDGTLPSTSSDSGADRTAADDQAVEDAGASQLDAAPADGATPDDGGTLADATSLTDADSDAGASDTGVDMSDAAKPSDATVDAQGSDAGELPVVWPAGCTVFSVRPAQATAISATLEVLLDAPWGNTPVQALAMRAVVDNPSLRDMSLRTAATRTLARRQLATPLSPALPSNVAYAMASGTGSLILARSFDSAAGSTAMDRSGFEVCVVSGAARRPQEAGFMELPSVASIPANVTAHPTETSCKVALSAETRLLGLAFRLGNLVTEHVVALNVLGFPFTLHTSPNWYDSPSNVALTNTLTSGSVLTSSCTYANPSSTVYTFEQQPCWTTVIYAPAGALSCTL